MDSTILKELNSSLKNKFSSEPTSEKVVKSNVSIAAAVTSYARIQMIKYKLKYDIYYTDTDSIFTSNDLPELEVGTELGMMKDELMGGY